jgi:hypothetical protein
VWGGGIEVGGIIKFEIRQKVCILTTNTGLAQFLKTIPTYLPLFRVETGNTHIVFLGPSTSGDFLAGAFSKFILSSCNM